MSNADWLSLAISLESAMTFFSITCARDLTDFPRGVNVSQSTAMTARGRKALFVKTIVLSFYVVSKD